MKFPLGQIVATPAALESLANSGQTAEFFLSKHAAGDWGTLDEGDARLNDEAVTNGDRILSAYRTLKGEKIWIITEGDRSATTLLLAEDY